jgi:hypothetical protein
MAAESFFARWSRKNAETAPDAAETVPAEQPEQPPSLPPPTIEDVAELTPESDYTRFVGKGIDDNIQRAALKKLFSDPHFNIMDGLDVYIEDYHKFDPITPEMLGLLNHAKGLLDPLSQFEQPLMRLMEDMVRPEQAAADDMSTASISASAPQDSELAESNPDSSMPDDSAPSPTTTKPDDDDTIQSM